MSQNDESETVSHTSHQSVLLHESVDALITEVDGFYVDGTFGRGGHSREVLSRLSAAAQLMAVDKDEQAIAEAGKQFASDARFSIRHGSFSQLNQWLIEIDKLGKVNGILLDLGVSSPQLDEAHRGFSFMQDGPLDMRMDRTQGETAAQWINSASQTDIARVLKEYGEERYSKRIARAIVEYRDEQPFVTTHELSKVVTEANPAWEKGKHPATRAFQAIRIHINNELSDLDVILEQALAALAVGGRLVVISFHSLEDRRVKRFIRQQVQGDRLPIGVPIRDEELNKRLRSMGKMIKAGEQELSVNPRARSAVMRVAEKIA
jgi:16S rRNA (cytosine1402-N4)-methyltransferase